MSKHQDHHIRNERYPPLHHSRHESEHERNEKNQTTPKNLAATLGIMGLAIGAALLVEGGPWKSRMAAAATVVGMEQVLERSGYFDGEMREMRETRGVDGERRGRGHHGRRNARSVDDERRRRAVVDDEFEDENDGEESRSRYRYQYQYQYPNQPRDRRERERERGGGGERYGESRRHTTGTVHGHVHDSHDSNEKTRKEIHDEERRHRERRREANRRFDEQFEIEEVLA